MTLGEYHDVLSKHDWTYEYSDDHRVWKRGREAEGELLATAHFEGPAYLLMYRQFYASIFNSQPVPPRPSPDQEQALKSIMSQE